MKKIHFVLILIIWGGMSSCKRKEEPIKILDPLPLNSLQTCVPGEMGQAWVLLKRDCLKVLVPVINLTTIPNSTFPQVTGPDSLSRYTFQTSDGHYGTATFTIRFFQENGTVIDPILTNTSTTTLKSVSVNVIGSSSRFSYTENLVLTLDTAGIISSNKRFTGTSAINDVGNINVLTFTMPSPGIRSAFEGMVEGQATVTGTGPSSQTTSMTLAVSADHTTNGNITWEGLSGGIHYEENATGYVITNQYQLLLQ